jgi:small subunit ribosomal protein S17
MSNLEKRKVREGLVVSNKMAKTVVVAVETRKVHPLYKKAVRRTKKYKAHDENSACKIGDKVRIVETRPLSKEKRWRVTEIVSTEKMVETKPKRDK